MMNEVIAISPGDQSYVTHEWAVLLFESPWCGGCKDVLKIMERFPLDTGVDCFWGRVDITQNQVLAQQYGVMSLPTVIIFHQGIPRERFSGTMSEGAFVQKVKKYIEHVP